MTKKAKLLERVRNSPKDTRFSEVQKLLKDAGLSGFLSIKFTPLEASIGSKKVRKTNICISLAPYISDPAF